MTWGLTDKYTSLNATSARADRQPQRPLPLDAAMVRKSAWYALEFWFKNTSKRATPTITDVRQEKPVQTRLLCYPNPASTHCMIEFTLPSSSDVLVRFVDAKGRDVSIVTHAVLEGGLHRIQADVSALSSGGYTCVVQGLSFLASTQVIVQK
jgi:Secretion system C-terminal sorting domain